MSHALHLALDLRSFRGMVPRLDDTIVAIATPAGEGALAIVRLSGKHALEIADRLFTGRVSLSTVAGFTIHHGRARFPGGDEIDEVLASVFRGPRSFTGEDSVEFSCHGGMLVTHLILDGALAAGARRAEPGEFTRRAFLNGRMDLSQAEAVADLIAARTDKAVRASLNQLAGRLGTRIRALKADLLDLCASLEMDLDFSEEGIHIIAPEEVARRLSSVKTQLAEAAATFSGGRLLREGLSVPIVGKPNTGKSSLFNALLKESRAIVTHIPGTTRDFLEESISVSGILLRLIDTAGLRTPGDVVEAEGIRRTMDLVGRGDIILVTEDVTSQKSTPAILADLPPLGQFQKVVVARTKADLKPGLSAVPVMYHEAGVLVVEVSALTGYGIREIEKALIDVVGIERVGSESTLAVTNRRHWDALQKGIQNLDSALASLRAGSTNEFVAFDVRECTLALSSITGEVTTEDVLNHIFSRFCIGK
ncbi:MAG TPA: tRNA uridine-5-carboxymethylaminomethyl(34) synthesis GTPase MnmE [Desulfobacterales bacterium]|nr:tRNA uridine-5-carboxymethylaminomethyl(34) synthesis GTPase MnmE [Desulfobacterales bacterium]